MNYELLTDVELGSDGWEKVQKNLKKRPGKVLTLASENDFRDVLKAAGLQGINVIDRVTKRHYDPDSYRFFNETPVPTGANVVVNEDWTKSVLLDGEEIAEQNWFDDTRRAVMDVEYNNPDGTLDYIEEYASDGSVFSNIFYYENKITEIEFFNNKAQVVLRYFYYEEDLNLVVVEDPKTHQVLRRYDDLDGFLVDELKGLLKPTDTVYLHYLGLEVDSLRLSRSHNVIELVEPPLDENGEVRGNLAAIMTNEIPWIQEVIVQIAYYQDLVASGLPMDKVKMGD